MLFLFLFSQELLAMDFPKRIKEKVLGGKQMEVDWQYVYLGSLL